MYDIKNYHRADNISHAVALLEKILPLDYWPVEQMF